MSDLDEAVRNGDASKIVELMRMQIVCADNFTCDGAKQLHKKSLETLKALLQSAMTVVNSKIVDFNKQEISSSATACGETLLEIDNIQCFEPRGRFKLKVSKTAILLEGKQFSVLIPSGSVSQIICLPSFTSAKKEGEDYLAFKLEDSVKINSKDSMHILLNLSRTTNPTAVSKYGGSELNEATVVVMAVQEATGVYTTRPQAQLFSSIRESKPYLKCYRGTQEGAIYPLQSGVVFIKPLLIIPADEIASLSAGRGGGAGNTRYVDLQVIIRQILCFVLFFCAWCL